MDKYHVVKRLSIEGNMIQMSVDGRDYKVDIRKISKRLAKATPAQKNNFVISPAGYGIHWPDIDEDLSVDSIIGIKHEVPSIKMATA